MATKIYLGFQTLVWLGYGLYMIFQPGYLAEIGGVVATTPTGTTEIRAMYGGLEAGIGLLTLSGILKPDLTRCALLGLLFVVGGLAAGRLFGVLVDGSLSTYTIGALCFEVPSTLLTVFFLRINTKAPSST